MDLLAKREEADTHCISENVLVISSGELDELHRRIDGGSLTTTGGLCFLRSENYQH